MKTNTLGREGFTLIEIMIVVAIVGILGAIAIPNLLRARVNAVANACIGNLRQIDSAKQQWALEFRAGVNDVPQPIDLQPFIGRGVAGSLARVHCPLARPPAAMAGYSINNVGLPPECDNFNAAFHNAVIR